MGGGPLPAAERAEKARQAVSLSDRGVSATDIGERLSISRQLASNLVKEELAKRAEHDDQRRERQRSRYEYLYRLTLEDHDAAPITSLNKSGYINAAVRILERLDKIDGTEAAAKHEHSGPGGGPIEYRHDSERDERFERLYAELNSFGNSEDEDNGRGDTE